MLHNVFYGLGTLTAERPILKGTLGGLEIAFFAIAVIVCPIAFIVGMVGGIVMLVRRGRQRSRA